jgi:hypothetical protein
MMKCEESWVFSGEGFSEELLTIEARWKTHRAMSWQLDLNIGSRRSAV